MSWTFKPAPGVAPELASETAAELAAIKPYRARRVRINPTALEDAGAARLAAPAPDLKPSARYKVRIWYRSQGGEVLMCDSERLTAQGRDALVRSLYGSDALGWAELTLDASGREVSRYGGHAGAPGARFVVLPSQRPERPERPEVVQDAPRKACDCDHCNPDRWMSISA